MNIIGQVRDFMESYVEECIDEKTGEVNTTLLAEMAADELNIYEGVDYDIPEWVFDIAFEFDNTRI